jgi:hypothetical protein
MQQQQFFLAWIDVIAKDCVVTGLRLVWAGQSPATTRSQALISAWQVR